MSGRVDTAAIRRVRLTILLGAGVTAAATLAAPAARQEMKQALEILTSGSTAALRDYILSYGAWAPAVSALLMLLQALAAPVPAFLLTFANGLAFGFLWGGLLTIGSATLAAALSFGIARALGRRAAEALVGAGGLARADRFFVENGVWAVLIARLIPVVSFDAVSYAAGLTRMRLGPFLVATVVGMAPATIAYTYLGDQAPESLPWLLGGAAVITIILLAGLWWRRLHRQDGSN